MILSPLQPASLAHKNPSKTQNDSWHVSHRMQRMIDRFEDFLVEYPVTDFRLDFDFAYVIFVQITLSSQLQAIPTG